MTARDGKVLFVYWGRRGSLSMIATELARDLRDRQLESRLSYSTANELAPELAALTPVTQPFRTFRRSRGALTGLMRMRRQLAALVATIDEEGYAAVVILMSHVWTPFLGRRLRRHRARFVVVVHDAARHPGDRTGLVQGWLQRDIAYADEIIALSQSVADRLKSASRPPRSLHVVSHPVVSYRAEGMRSQDGPVRVLFLGRIMAYKGLPLLAEAVRILQSEGLGITLGVFGEGDLGSATQTLADVHAEIVNRWIDHSEIGAILARHDVLVLPYVEASQSGVAAAAQGAGLPIIATPVGGLTEQVRDGVDGLIAAEASAEAIADCLRRVGLDRSLLHGLAAATREGHTSIADFVNALTAIAVGRTS